MPNTVTTGKNLVGCIKHPNNITLYLKRSDYICPICKFYFLHIQGLNFQQFPKEASELVLNVEIVKSLEKTILTYLLCDFIDFNVHEITMFIKMVVFKLCFFNQLIVHFPFHVHHEF